MFRLLLRNIVSYIVSSNPNIKLTIVYFKNIISHRKGRQLVVDILLALAIC